MDPETLQLLEEIFGYFGDDRVEYAKRYPEQALKDLLQEIRDDLPSPGGGVLKMTVDMGTLRTRSRALLKRIKKK